MKAKVQGWFREAVAACGFDLGGAAIPTVQVEVPAAEQHGDFASNIAMQLAKVAKKPPKALAGPVAARLAARPEIAKAEVAGPGFINVTLRPLAWLAVLEDIYTHGTHYGRSNMGAGHKVNLEFVSANPTGPLHIGHGRGAVTGDAVGRLLAFAGFDVTREYYVNDWGSQVQHLARSLCARYRQALGDDVPVPEGGYPGDYLIAAAQDLVGRFGDIMRGTDPGGDVTWFKEHGIALMLARIRSDLVALDIHFDVWTSESSLYADGLVAAALDELGEKGFMEVREGAQWFLSSKFGDEKDRVAVRSTGETTYFASDAAYHRHKLRRGFDRLINVWGADHHGYIPRMKAVIAALDGQPEKLEIILVQMVNLLRGGVAVPMGKRKEFHELHDLVAETGRDAVRFYFCMRAVSSQLDFDIELAQRQTAENPVFYVQMGHARICSIQTKAVAAGYELPAWSHAAAAPLTAPDELRLIKLMGRFPEVVEHAAVALEPHRIVHYLLETTDAFHSYYTQAKRRGDRVISDDIAATTARLLLVGALKQVLQNALQLVGVSAPERMAPLEASGAASEVD